MSDRQILPSTGQLIDVFHHCFELLIRCVAERSTVGYQTDRGLPCGELRDEFVRSLDATRRELLDLAETLQGWYEGKAVTVRATERAIDVSDEESLFQALAQLYPPGTRLSIQPPENA